MAPRWLSNRQSPWGHADNESLTTRSLVIGACVVFLIGIGAGYGLQSATSSDGSTNEQSADNPVIDASVAAMPNAPHTADGAVRAVTSYITGFPSVALMSQQQQKDALDTLLSPNADPNLRSDLTLVLNNARNRLTGVGSLQRANTARLVTAPASYKVDMLSPDEARVQVWFMTVYIDSNGAKSESTWATNDIRVQWTDHWRLASFAAKGGPTPALFSGTDQPSSYNEVISVFNGFKAYRYAPAATTPVAK